MATAKVSCPICKKKVAFGAPEMPFCSERCRLIDLGNWASEKYRIPASGAYNELGEGEDSEEPEAPEGPDR